MQGRCERLKDWGGMSTPLLSDVVPDIDANPVSLYGSVGAGQLRSVAITTQSATNTCA